MFSWIGATAALECKFEGNPLPNIAWYGSDDSQITDGVQPTVNNKAEYLATSVLEVSAAAIHHHLMLLLEDIDNLLL